MDYFFLFDVPFCVPSLFILASSSSLSSEEFDSSSEADPSKSSSTPSKILVLSGKELLLCGVVLNFLDNLEVD